MCTKTTTSFPSQLFLFLYSTLITVYRWSSGSNFLNVFLSQPRTPFSRLPHSRIRMARRLETGLSAHNFKLNGSRCWLCKKPLMSVNVVILCDRQEICIQYRHSNDWPKPCCRKNVSIIERSREMQWIHSLPWRPGETCMGLGIFQ